MSTFVCSQVVNNVCQSWAVNENLLDALAITTAQAEQIATAIVGVMLTAFIIGEIAHMIKVNFERRF